jgi:hypothetical protein
MVDRRDAFIVSRAFRTAQKQVSASGQNPRGSPQGAPTEFAGEVHDLPP